MEERRQPVEERVAPSRESLMRLVQQSPRIMRVLEHSTGTRRLPKRFVSSTTTTNHSLPTTANAPKDPSTRCEACLSLFPEKLEVEFGHLSQREATGILHHNFDNLNRSAANGCDLCQILLWAVHRSTYSQSATTGRNLDKITSSNERFYLRLYKGHSAYNFKPSLLLCLPCINPSTEHLNVGVGLKWTEFAAADAYSEPPATEAQTISDHPDSEATYKLIEKWLIICRQTHATCQAVSKQVTSEVLPKRLIDVGSADGVEMPRVIDTRESNVKYAALSYAWGVSGKHTLLTTANADAFSRGIDLSSLPETFQDAILVCQKLSVKYLWIDALCILQSRLEDGRPNEELSEQIAIMGQIYANAVFTIAAASASSVHQGLFRREKRFPTILESHPLYTIPTEKQWYVTPPEPDWRAMITNGPLQQRGWVMQERTLSRRILHYTHWAVFWECTELKASEFRPLDITSAYPLYDPQFAPPFSGCYKGLPIASKTPEENAELLTNVWAVAVADYTNRRLTSDEDMLPAISSVAQRFQQLTGDVYLAGLWQSVLWLNLMWYCGGGVLPRRPTKYNAPSWSWASVMGRAVMTVRDRPDAPSLTILSVSTTPLSMANPYGQVKSGSLQVRSSLRKGFRAIRRRMNALVQHYIQRPPQPSTPVETVVGSISVKYEIPDLNRPESKVIFDVRSDDELGFCVLQLCALMQSGFKRDGHPFFYALAIVPTDVDGEYRRIGLVEVCDERLFDEPEAAVTTLTLI